MMDQSLGFNLLSAFHFPLLLHQICMSVLRHTTQKLGRGEVPYFLCHFVCIYDYRPGVHVLKEMSLSRNEHLVA